MHLKALILLVSAIGATVIIATIIAVICLTVMKTMKAPENAESVKYGAIKARLHEPEAPVPTKVEEVDKEVARIIHRCWQFFPGTPDEIHPRYHQDLDKSLNATPSWESWLWRGKEAEKFVKENYPHLYETYMSYKKPVQRADAFRYMILHAFGGFYSDMDITIYNMADMMSVYSDKKAFFFVETYLNDKQIEDSKTFTNRNGEPEHRERIANYFMGCAKGHPIMLDIIEEMVKRSKLPVNNAYDVLYTTGPDLVTTVVQAKKHLYPDLMILSLEQADRVMRHHASGTWRNQ